MKSAHIVDIRYDVLQSDLVAVRFEPGEIGPIGTQLLLEMPQCGFLQIDLAVQGHAVRFKAFVAQFDGRPVQLGIERILSKTRSGEIDRSSLDLKLIAQRIKGCPKCLRSVYCPS